MSVDIEEKTKSNVQNIQCSPLDPEKLRECRSQWSLAGDAGLLLYLQQFSQRVISKTTQIEKLVDNLNNATKSSHCKVYNTFNDFLMLSSTQFIENRVYDEELAKDDSIEKESSTNPVEKTKEQLEQEVVPRFSAAVQRGIDVLSEAFITVHVQPADDDSEDEDSEYSTAYSADPIVEPKDVYAHRPLPYLIGSAEFIHSEKLGLFMMSDDEDDDEKVKDISSDEESDNSEVYKELSTDEEVTSDSKPNVDLESSSDASDEDLFAERNQMSYEIVDEERSDEEDDDKPEEVRKNDIHSELSKKLGVVPTKNANEDTIPEDKKMPDNGDTLKRKKIERAGSVSSKKSKRGSTQREKTHQNVSTDKDLFVGSNEDEDLFSAIGEEDLFAGTGTGLFGKKGKSLFSGDSGGLFDDHQDENDDSATPIKSPEDKLLKLPLEKDADTKPPDRKSIKKKPDIIEGLFDDRDIIGGNNLFGNAQKDSLSPKEETRPRKKTLTLFEDDDDDDIFGKPVSSKKMDTNYAATNKSVTTKPAEAITSKVPSIKPVSLFDDDSDDDDDGMFNHNESNDAVDASHQKSAKSNTKSNSDLFGSPRSEAEEDLFSTPRSVESGKNTMVNKTVIVKNKKPIQSLFNDYSDSDDDGDNGGGNNLPGDNLRKLSNADGEDISPIERSSSTSKKKPIGGVSMFGGFDPADSNKLLKKSPTKELNSNNLFGSPESEPELFATAKDSISVATNNESKNSQTRTSVKKTPMFGNDSDSSMNADSDNDKIVQLSSSVVVEPTLPYSSKDDKSIQDKHNDKTKPIGGISIFSDVDPSAENNRKNYNENDLFGSPDSDSELFATSSSKDSERNKNRKTPKAEKSKASLFGILSDSDSGEDNNKEKAIHSSSIGVGDEGSSDQDKYSAKNKPIGGVSLFADFDPSAVKKNVHNKNVSDLFGSPESEPELFTPLKDSVVVRTTNESTDGSKRSAVTKTPLFGNSSDSDKDEDHGQDDSVMSTSTPDNKVPLKNDESVQDKHSTKKKPVGGISIFGDFDPSSTKKEDDDLFGSPESESELFLSPKLKPDETDFKSHKTNTDHLNIFEKKESGMHGSSSEIITKNTVKKKPAGAVSMFGSFDPAPERSPAKSKVYMFGDVKDAEDAEDQLSTVTTSSRKEEGLSEPSATASSGVKNNILESATKTRSRGQANRRPPSRQRKADTSTEEVSSTQANTVDNEQSSSPQIYSDKDDRSPQTDLLFTTSKTDIQSQKSESESLLVKKSDLFSSEGATQSLSDSSKISLTYSNENSSTLDTTSSSNPVKIEKSGVEDIFASKMDNNDDDEDIFSVKKKDSKSKKKAVKKQTDDDLFGATGSIFDDVPAKSKKKKKKDADSDIFASTKTVKKKARDNKPKTEPASTRMFEGETNIFDDPLNALGE